MGIIHDHLFMEFTYLILFVLREFLVMFLILICEIVFRQLNFSKRAIGIINFVKRFPNFIELVSKYNVGLKTLLL